MIALKPAVAWLGPPLRSLGVAVIGGAIAMSGALQARQPDSVLSSIAMENARICAAGSASDERDFALAMLAAGVAVALYGLYQLWQWVKLRREGAR